MDVRRTSPRSAALGKLSLPRLGRHFNRERLFAQLDAMASSPGTWLAAPPGAGKTTLVATWLQSQSDPLLWLQADAGDADPATFLRWLDLLWRQHLPDRVDLPAPNADDLGDLGGFLRRRLRALLPLLPERWVLVIDNHQELPPQAPLQAALAGALTELPAGVRWIFISRDAPPPAFAVALARQQLQLLLADAMRLDEAETLALIRLHGRQEALIEALAPAQGWAAGLTLMLMGRPRAAHLPALEARDRLFDYFAEEVLARLPDAQQQALCLLAYLPSTTVELAVAMTAQPGVHALLERMAAASLFVDRREAAQPVYVFHALFSEFLLRRHERGRSPEEVQQWRLHAARLLLVAGDVDAGLSHLVATEAWADAEAAVAAHASTYLAQGRLAALRRVIDALPTPVGDRLAYWRGFSALEIDPASALADAERAHAQAQAVADPEGRLAAIALAATALVAMGRMHALDLWIDALDDLAGITERALDERGLELRVLPGLLAALVYHRPWHAWTAGLAERAERLLHRDAAAGQRLLLGSLGFYFLWRGEMDRLDRIIDRIDALCVPGRSAPAALMRWWGVGILVKTLVGRVASAHDDVRRMLELVDAEPSLARQRASAELQGCIVALALADRTMARHHLDRAALALHPDNASDRTMYEHQRAMFALLEDDRPTALRLARAAAHSGALSGFAIREHIALISNALAAARSDEHAEALQVLQAVQRHPLYPVCRWHQWIGGCVAAYAAVRRGDMDAAGDELRRAFGVARSHGFRGGPQLYVVADMMPCLVALALTLDIEPEVARDLVQRHRLRAPPQADDRWPWPVRLWTLGRFAVEVDGAPMPSSRKESRRLLELLRLLAAHGTAGLAQDCVADALWPEADGDAARNALDNALFRLRKLLGGEDRVLLRHGTLSLNSQRCWVDFDVLQRSLQELLSAPPAQAAYGVGRVAAVYRGLLLPDDTQPVVVARREALQRQLATTLTPVVERLVRADMADAAQVARRLLAGQ